LNEGGGSAREREVRLAEILRPANVVAPLPADTVQAAVSVLAQRLMDGGEVADPERLARLFAEGRIRDTVHVGGRVILPHLRTEAVERLVVALGVTPVPLNDGPGGEDQGAQVVVLVLAPPSATGLYLQTLAALARVMRNDHVVDAMVAATTAQEILSIPEVAAISIQPRLTVRDVMAPRVYRVGPDATVREVLDLIADHGFRAVPVVDEDRGVLGMVTDRDLMRFFLPVVQKTTGESPGSLKDTPVREVMSRSVICVSEDQALTEVMSIMVAKDVERLPVVSEGKLTGFLTRGDILRKLFAFP
jgi:CBS domain-containing protein/mannitol/fructose-specific phosphotransferase system IIA component (Ntr-type)